MTTICRKFATRVAAVLLAALAPSLAAPPVSLAQGNASAPAAAPREILIRNATVWTAAGPAIPNGSVLIRDGKIAAVGADVRASDRATVVDATGKFVTPGVVDCHSHIAIDGGVNEGGLAVTSLVRIADVIDSEDRDIFYDLSGGVTCANVLHGSANPIGGQNAVIKLRWGMRADDLIFREAPPGIKFALGENPKRSNFTTPPGQARRYPATRMGVENVIRDAFTRARNYKAELDRYAADAAAGKKDLVAPRRDLELEPLVEVLEGKRLVHAHCYVADEILMLLRVARDFNFRVATFQHVLEGYKVAGEIAAAGVGASTFADNWAYKVEAYDAIPYNAAILHRAGVLVSLNSDDTERGRRLNTDAARAVRYGGVPRDEAFKMITINAAKQLGVDRWTGSLEVGKDADVAVWSGDPLSSYSVVEKVFIDGRQYFDRRDAIARADVDAREKERLKAKEKAAANPPPPPQPPPPAKPPAAPAKPQGGDQ